MGRDCSWCFRDDSWQHHQSAVSIFGLSPEAIPWIGYHLPRRFKQLCCVKHGRGAEHKLAYAWTCVIHFLSHAVLLKSILLPSFLNLGTPLAMDQASNEHHPAASPSSPSHLPNTSKYHKNYCTHTFHVSFALPSFTVPWSEGASLPTPPRDGDWQEGFPKLLIESPTSVCEITADVRNWNLNHPKSLTVSTIADSAKWAGASTIGRASLA